MSSKRSLFASSKDIGGPFSIQTLHLQLSLSKIPSPHRQTITCGCLSSSRGHQPFSSGLLQEKLIFLDLQHILSVLSKTLQKIMAFMLESIAQFLLPFSLAKGSRPPLWSDLENLQYLVHLRPHARLQSSQPRNCCLNDWWIALWNE